MSETSEPVPQPPISPAIPQPPEATTGMPAPSTVPLPADPVPTLTTHTDLPIHIPDLHILNITALGGLVDRWHKYAKAVVCFVIAAAGGGVAQGIIVGAPAAYVTVVIGALATVGVVAKANTVT